MKCYRLTVFLAATFFLFSPYTCSAQLCLNPKPYHSHISKPPWDTLPDLTALIQTAFNPIKLPRDPFFSRQWYLSERRGVGAVQAWRALGHYGNPRITIAIIDGGVDPFHPDIKGKIVYPYDVFTGLARLPRGPSAGTHGTPVATLAAGSMNSAGIVGIAPQAKLMPIQGLTLYPDLIERMFQHTIRYGADIVSCSWGICDPKFELSPRTIAAIEDAMTYGRNGKGSVVVFAAGNEGKDQVNHFGKIPGVIVVGAVTSAGQHATYSNRGPEISVVAPSDGELPLYAGRASWDNDPYQPPFVKEFGGTSAATAIVSGVCALVLSANPNLTAVEVKYVIEQTADKIGNYGEYDERGHSPRFGYGRVNAARAVELAKSMR